MISIVAMEVAVMARALTKGFAEGWLHVHPYKVTSEFSNSSAGY
jgi:hypothetical protein